MTDKTYDNYVKEMQRIADLGYATALLNWDKEVNMPSKGAGIRTRQVATLSGLAHERFTGDSFSSIIKELSGRKNDFPQQQKRNIELTAKRHDRATKFSTEFVERNSRAVSEAYMAWLKAREANDYSVFKNALGNLIEIRKEEAEIIGYENHPYEAHLDQFEPGGTVPHLDELFKDVKEQLVKFVKELREKEQVEFEFLHHHYDKDKQWDFGIEVLKLMHYDFDAGRQDLSPHPFTTNFAPTDVRVTTRIHEDNFGSMTWSCIHEGGHALYEQGLPLDQYGLPVGSAVSLGIHESQSRLWENNVGRSLPFWKAHYGLAQKYFPENLGSKTAEQFYKAINKVEPSLIRVESDELNYHFHILIRYEIEKGLMEGTYSVEGLDQVWNAKYKEYLGVEVPDDKRGILQDIHWAYGSIGYFPTYSLGSFYAAQFFRQAEKDIPGLVGQIEEGNTSNLLTWLRENIHRHGSLYSADELCKRITGESLNFKYFMEYAKKKYEGIYG